MEDASTQEVEVHSPGRWPYWYVERYTRFMDTLQRVGCSSRRKEIRWRNREPVILLGEIHEGTRWGTNFLRDCTFE